MFDDLIPKEPTKPTAKPMGYAEDVARAAASGVGRGALSLGGIVGDIQELSRMAGRKLGFEPPARSAFGRVFGRETAPTSRGMIEAGQEAGVPGLDYQPQTLPGQFAHTVGEFIPGALLGPGGVARNVARFGVVPGVAAEAAGQVTEGTALEPWARGGAALAAGGVGALATRPSVAERTLAEAARGMTRPQVLAMETLMRDAQAAGLPLTRAEAAQAVTGGATRLADVQRVVEGQGGLREMMAQRPAQVEAVGRGAIGQIAPTPTQPSVTGPQISKAAEDVIIEANKSRTERASPFYQAAGPNQIAAEDVAKAVKQIDKALAADTSGLSHGPLMELRDSLVAQPAVAPVAATRTPVIDPRVQNITRFAATPAVAGKAEQFATDIANLDRVKKYFRDRGELPAFAEKAIDKETSAKISRITGQLEAAAEKRSVPYRFGQHAYREATRDIIDPLMAGPIGKLANTPEVSNAIQVLFPRNPVPNSAGEVLSAVQKLSIKNKQAAQQLVRAHVESVFNNATRDLQAGPSGFGGASFRAQLVGNTQQAENMAAAIRGLPGGAAILPGFDRMLEIMEATGQRQRIGSQTAFNAEMQAALQSGGILGETAALTGGVGMQVPKRVLERFKQWNLGRNTDELARLLTDPRATGLFRALAQAPRGSSKAVLIATRLGTLSGAAKLGSLGARGERSADYKATRSKNAGIMDAMASTR